MKSIVLKVLIAVMFCIAATKAVQAGTLEAAMQDQLNMMVNTTDPSYVETARKGVVTGGSMIVRSKIMNPQWANFQMPSASGGCGGWNIFGGSFSFISSEQIVAMLRSIASNAIGLAFKSALDLISPHLYKILAEMEAAMQAMNNGAMNSCQIATKLTDALKGEGDFHVKDLLGADASKHFGLAMDEIGAWARGEESSDKTPAAKTSEALNPADAEQAKVLEAIIEGNLTWNVLKRADAVNWTVVGGGGSIKEEMMTLVGTQIVCKPGVENCPADDQEQPGPDGLMLSVKEAGAIDFKTFVDGTSTGQSVKLLRCGTGNINQDKCLNPLPIDTTMKGFKVYVKDILCGNEGPTCSTSSSGLISRYKVQSRSGVVPSAADLSMIAALESAGIWTAIKNIAVSNERAGRNYADAMLPNFSAEVAYNIINDTLKSMNAAAMSINNGRDLKTQEQIRKAFEKINGDYMAYKKDNEVKQNVLAFYQDVLNQANSNRNYYLPQSY